MHRFLFAYTPAADKRGACSLLAQTPEATPPRLHPQPAGTRTDCLTRPFPQQQLAQSPPCPSRRATHRYAQRDHRYGTQGSGNMRSLYGHTHMCGLSWLLTKSSLAAPRSKRQHCCSTATPAAGARGGRSWVPTLSPCRSGQLAGA